MIHTKEKQNNIFDSLKNIFNYTNVMQVQELKKWQFQSLKTGI